MLFAWYDIADRWNKSSSKEHMWQLDKGFGTQWCTQYSSPCHHSVSEKLHCALKLPFFFLTNTKRELFISHLNSSNNGHQHAESLNEVFPPNNSHDFLAQQIPFAGLSAQCSPPTNHIPLYKCPCSKSQKAGTHSSASFLFVPRSGTNISKKRP